MNRGSLQLSVALLFLPVSGQGDEPPSLSLEAATGVTFSAPRVRFPDGREVVLVRDLVEGKFAFRGPVGTPAAGLVANVAFSRSEDSADAMVEFSSTAPLKDVQLVQPVSLDQDWRSYVIAPGAVYGGNRFLVSPQPYAPYLLTEGVTPAGPIAIADVPRLSADRAYRVELAANASMPVVGIFDASRQTGYLLGVEIYGSWGVMAVDSESNYALLAGLMKLHDATGEARYLAWARQTADLFCTWVLAYDARLPADSPLGRLGVQARGAVFANIQNQHGAPGICTASGVALLELYEATGEERYLRTLEDIVTCAPRMIVRPGQEWIWKKMPPGCVSERLMTMDGMEPCGETQAMSTWAEIAMLHMIRELPPHYRDVARGREATFDRGNTRLP
jgi:hypothetical protein